MEQTSDSNIDNDKQKRNRHSIHDNNDQSDSLLQQQEQDDIDEVVNAFECMAARAGVCLIQSDMQRDAIGKAAGSQASSATNWIHDASAFRLQQVMNRIHFQVRIVIKCILGKKEEVAPMC